MHPLVLVRGRRVVGNDGAGDDADAGVRGAVVHRPQLPGHVLGGAPLIDVVDPGDDDDRRRRQADHVAREARRDLIAALAVHPAIQHLPVGMRRISQ